MNANFDGKICILYGLRRTGKTTMIFQMIGELPIEKTAYIKVKSDDHMSLLSKDLDKLYGLGYKYIFRLDIKTKEAHCMIVLYCICNRRNRRIIQTFYQL